MPEHYNTVLLESIEKKRDVFLGDTIECESLTKKTKLENTITSILDTRLTRSTVATRWIFFFVTLLDYLFGFYEVELSFSLRCKSNYINIS